MEIKGQNLSKISKDKLYQLLIRKDINDTDREKIKNELIKREADELFNQAQRVRSNEITKTAPAFPGKITSGPGSRKMAKINPVIWVFLVFLVIMVGFILFTALTK